MWKDREVDKKLNKIKRVGKMRVGLRRERGREEGREKDRSNVDDKIIFVSSPSFKHSYKNYQTFLMHLKSGAETYTRVWQCEY